MFLAWFVLRVNPYESSGVGLEVFEISAVWIRHFFIIFRQDCGCISGEMTGHFLTVQEEPFKILMANKQKVSSSAQGKEAASHPGARKQAPLNLTVVCFQTLSSLPDLENDIEPVLMGLGVVNEIAISLHLHKKLKMNQMFLEIVKQLDTCFLM